MKEASLARDGTSIFDGSAAAFRTSSPPPSRCPYCAEPSFGAPDMPRHWIRWGSYSRYAGDPDDVNLRVSVPRYRCKLVRRTFSLLPDHLLPYCSLRTALVLACLHGLFVHTEPLAALARRRGIPRSTLRRLRARYSRTVFLLRLPSRAGPLDAAAFITSLMAGEPSAIADLFRNWKEREPKHSVVGIYAR